MPNLLLTSTKKRWKSSQRESLALSFHFLGSKNLHFSTRKHKSIPLLIKPPRLLLMRTFFHGVAPPSLWSLLLCSRLSFFFHSIFKLRLKLPNFFSPLARHSRGGTTKERRRKGFENENKPLLRRIFPGKRRELARAVNKSPRQRRTREEERNARRRKRRRRRIDPFGSLDVLVERTATP